VTARSNEAPAREPLDDPIFRRDGSGRFVPTVLATGPWSADAQHGGAPAALLGRSFEAVEREGPMLVARMTVEFLRPVPLAPLEVETSVLRPGRRVQLLGGSLRAAGVEVCRATALRIRRTEDPVVEPTGDEPAPPPPETGAVAEAPARFGDTFIGAFDQRWVSGSFAEMGPATVWMRLLAALVEGEDPSPLVRTLAAADFGNGVSATLDWDRFVFVNPDLTVYLDREPAGEWVCLEARSRIAADGTGSAESALHDERGRIGRSIQALYVDSQR
jgi:hypothetical protein